MAGEPERVDGLMRMAGARVVWLVFGLLQVVVVSAFIYMLLWLVR
jgi:hypothetical protein